MACQRCIAIQKRIVRILCKKPDCRLCRKARERLAKLMETK
jgi:hypothetical protein